MKDRLNVVVDVKLPEESMTMFICASNDGNDFYHQGMDEWLILKSHKPFLPMWFQFCIIGICLCFSALFSGLNLGLMSLDRTDLKVIYSTISFNDSNLMTLSHLCNRFCAIQVSESY